MTYIELINRFWKMNKEILFTSYESHLYLKLLDTCNSLGWKLCFTQSNRYLCAETGMSERKLIETRENLMEFGLITFESGKRKRDLTQYVICGLKGAPPKLSPPPDPEDDTDSSEKESKTPENSENVNDNSNPVEEENNSDRENNSEIFDEKNSENDSENDSGNGSGNGSENDSENDSEFSKKGTDNIRVKRKDRNKDKKRKKRGDKSPLSTVVDARVPVSKIMDEFNRLCVKLPKANTKSEARGRAVRARMKEHGLEAVMKMIKLTSESDYLGGKNKDNWMASFDWLFKPTNFVKVIEGNYANKAPSKTSTDFFNNKPSPLQLLEEAYENLVNNGTNPG